ncbi:MAG: hypothetical protein EZS28_041693, partial [Streblomastix strix]
GNGEEIVDTSKLNQIPLNQELAKLQSKSIPDLTKGFTLKLSLTAHLDAQSEDFPAIDLGIFASEYYYLGNSSADFSYHGEYTFSDSTISFLKSENIFTSMLAAIVGEYNVDVEDIASAYEKPVTIQIINGYAYNLTTKDKNLVDVEQINAIYESVQNVNEQTDLSALTQADLTQWHNYLADNAGLDLEFFEKEDFFVAQAKQETTWGSVSGLVEDDSSGISLGGFLTPSSVISLAMQGKFTNNILSGIHGKTSLDGAFETGNFLGLSGKFNYGYDVNISFGKDNQTLAADTFPGYSLQPDVVAPGNLITILGALESQIKKSNNYPKIAIYRGTDGPVYLYDLNLDGDLESYSFDLDWNFGLSGPTIYNLSYHLNNDGHYYTADINGHDVDIYEEDLIYLARDYELSEYGSWKISADSNEYLYLYDIDEDGFYDVWGSNPYQSISQVITAYGTNSHIVTPQVIKVRQ